MLQQIKKVFFILGDKKRKLVYLILVFLILSFFEVLGIGLIAPYMTLVIGLDTQNQYFGIISKFIDLSVFTKKELLFFSACFLILIFTIKAFFSVLLNYVICLFSQDVRIDLQIRLLHQYTSKNFEMFSKVNMSEYIFVINELTRRYTNQVLMTLIKTFSDLVLAFIIICFLFFASGPYVLYVILFIGIFFLFYNFFVKQKLFKYGKNADTFEKKAIQNIIQNFKAFQEIKIYRLNSYFINAIKANLLVYSKHFSRAFLVQQLPRYLMEFILVASVIFTTFISVMRDINVLALIPLISMYGIASLKIIPIATGFFNSNHLLRYNSEATNKLYETLKGLPLELDLNNNYNRKAFETFRSFQIKKLDFAFEGAKKIALKNINLEIKKGQIVALIGPSGSGKTTLLNVMLGFMNQRSNAIYFNGKPIKDNYVPWLNNVAYLPQRSVIINDTLRKNIALGLKEEEINDRLILRALHLANLSDFLKDLKNGLDTIIQEDGSNLSGGQIQRISLARAFYFNKNVMVMDEITSGLDDLTESKILEEISALRGQKTIVFITHKLSTINICDYVYQLKSGQIIREGHPSIIK